MPRRPPPEPDDDPPPRGWPRLIGDAAGCTPAMQRRRIEARDGPGRPTTAGQLRRHRRNLVICAAAAGGASERLIAEAVGLPRSRVNAILAEYRGQFGGASKG